MRLAVMLLACLCGVAAVVRSAERAQFDEHVARARKLTQQFPKSPDAHLKLAMVRLPWACSAWTVPTV
jgi:hypothetical protein